MQGLSWVALKPVDLHNLYQTLTVLRKTIMGFCPLYLLDASTTHHYLKAGSLAAVSETRKGK